MDFPEPIQSLLWEASRRRRRVVISGRMSIHMGRRARRSRRSYNSWGRVVARATLVLILSTRFLHTGEYQASQTYTP